MIKTYKGLEYNLNKEIIRGRLLDTNRIERGVGKTKLLRDLAINNGFIVLISNRALAKTWNEYIGKKIYCSDIQSLRGNLLKGVLLEEGLSREQEKYAREHFNVIGGYSSNYNK